jgi:hypothetical protein
MASIDSNRVVGRLGIWRCAATGAAVLGVLFLACWLAVAFLSLRGSHMFIEIFTRSPVQSSAALAEGLCWSLVFGAATGALTALFYNLFGSRPRA